MNISNTVDYKLSILRKIKSPSEKWEFEYQIKKLSLARQQLSIREKNFVNCIKIDTSANQLLLSGDNMGKIRLFDLSVLDNNSHERYERCSTNSTTHPKCHTKIVTSLAWYPIDNGIFVSSSMDGYVNIWDTEQFEIVSHLRFDNPVQDVQMPLAGPFSHKLAAACTGLNGVTLLDLFSGSYLQQLESNQGVGTCCCWDSRHEHVLLVGDESGECTLYDIRKTGEQQIVGQLKKPRMTSPTAYSPVLSCLFTPDGSRIVILSACENPIHVYDAITLEEIPLLLDNVSNWERVVTKPAIASKGLQNYIVAPDPLNCCVQVIDLDTGKKVNTLRGHLDVCTCCDFRNTTCEIFSSGRDGFVLKYDSSNLCTI